MFKLKFREFDFQGFINFILELVDKHGMVQIRFFPEHKELFNETQLRHIAPNRTIDDPNGFVWAWIRVKDKVKKVTFDLYRDDRASQISMTIDLNKKEISLDKSEGISSVQVEEALKNNLKNLLSAGNFKNIFLDFLILIWNNKIASGVIIGLIVAYLAYKLGWNK